jgi:spore maturation protein CgeB
MTARLKIRYFAHSWVSDWNHGNAHFLRGLARSLVRLGHDVRCYEELGGWSLSNLVKQEGNAAIESVDQFRRQYPELDVRFYNNDSTFAAFARAELKEADLVIIHEWNDPTIVNQILALKKKYGFRALLHDTYHRAYTSAREILRFHLHLFDGVLAFGEAIRLIYTDGFGLPRAWTFHEAADTETFHPLQSDKNIDVLWVGNWGDEERTRELQEFLIGPAASLRDRKVVVYGVRYPEAGLERLAAAGIDYRGYLPNLSAPAVYSQSVVSLHVPRHQYSNGLSGIPTIRVFEALACGVPLVCSPWTDVEGLFRPDMDYVVVPNGRAMKSELRHLLEDDGARQQIAENGVKTIRENHTCEHRARQLLEICEELGK